MELDVMFEIACFLQAGNGSYELLGSTYDLEVY